MIYWRINHLSISDFFYEQTVFSLHLFSYIELAHSFMKDYDALFCLNKRWVIYLPCFINKSNETLPYGLATIVITSNATAKYELCFDYTAESLIKVSSLVIESP